VEIGLFFVQKLINRVINMEIKKININFELIEEIG